MAWISPDRPVFHGRARIAGTLAHQRMRPRPLDAPRGIFPLSRFRRSDRARGPI